MTDMLFTPSSWSAHRALATHGELRPQERLASEIGESMIRLPVGDDINNIFADPAGA
ncbi:MAG: hypothetical protein HKL92_00155 [Candidatus Eremiobacteraeota bacterium]|nr:hypothetical protein [Candidatus Eremiobacteraeota bacterium]